MELRQYWMVMEEALVVLAIVAIAALLSALLMNAKVIQNRDQVYHPARADGRQPRLSGHRRRAGQSCFHFQPLLQLVQLRVPDPLG